MRRGPAAKRRPRLAGVLLGLVATAAWGSSGVVMNPKGEPLEGVSVCYIVNNADGLCVSSDAQGKWSLPKSSIEEIRLNHEDYLTRRIPAGDPPEPVMLEYAATLLVKLVDRSGEPLDKGEVDLIFPSGRRISSFPVSSTTGTRIRKLQPGPVVIVARSEGFEEGRLDQPDLPAGKETVATVRLEPADSN